MSSQQFEPNFEELVVMLGWNFLEEVNVGGGYTRYIGCMIETTTPQPQPEASVLMRISIALRDGGNAMG
jgi:hypothetical protein